MSKDKLFDQFLDEIKSIHALKEQDYTGDRDPYFNFDFSQNFAAQFDSPVDKPFAYLIGTKLARLIVLLNQEIARPRNEPIEDTFKDLATYFLLWASKRKKLAGKQTRIEISREGFVPAGIGKPRMHYPSQKGIITNIEEPDVLESQTWICSCGYQTKNISDWQTHCRICLNQPMQTIDIKSEF